MFTILRQCIRLVPSKKNQNSANKTYKACPEGICKVPRTSVKRTTTIQFQHAVGFKIELKYLTQKRNKNDKNIVILWGLSRSGILRNSSATTTTKYSGSLQASGGVCGKGIARVPNDRRRVTDVHSICMSMFENEEYFEWGPFWNWTKTVILWLIDAPDAVFQHGCVSQCQWISKIYCSSCSNNAILKSVFSFKSSIRVRSLYFNVL